MTKKTQRVGLASSSPRNRSEKLWSRREALMLLPLAIFVFLIYSNTLGTPFILDDLPNIQNNPHIRLTKITFESIKRAGFRSPLSSRPIANITFALNYYYHKYNVMGYHLINILTHITSGILLYLFAKTTLSIQSLHSKYESLGWISFFTAFIWLVHPIQTQSITYIVQRMNSMAAMFYILSLLLYAKARLAEEKRSRWALFAGCVFSGILALGSKPIAATLPLFILLYEWYFFQELSLAWLKRHKLHLAGISILLAFVIFVYLGAHPFEQVFARYKTRDFTLTQRVLTEFRVVIYYISLLIFPHPSRLNLDHYFAYSNSLIDPITTLISVGAILALVGLSFYVAKKERLVSFCILWFLGNLVIESSVIPLEITFEHRTYLPSMLVSLMAVFLAHRLIKPQWLKIALLCAVVVVCSIWTYERNIVWSSELSLWRDCVKKSPRKARPHNNLGTALARQGKLDEAITHYSEALRFKPEYANAHFNLGNALTGKGSLDEAISHYSEALRIKPKYASAHNNLGIALAKKGNLDEAISHYSEALRIKPKFAEAHYNLGNALARKGSLKEAIVQYREALRIKPDHTDARNNLEVVSRLIHRSAKGMDNARRP